MLHSLEYLGSCAQVPLLHPELFGCELQIEGLSFSSLLDFYILETYAFFFLNVGYHEYIKGYAHASMCMVVRSSDRYYFRLESSQS